MNIATVIVLAFAIGLTDGLRSMTAPAVVAWAARWKWLDLQGSFLEFMGSAVATYILTAAAIGEIVVDKLPKTPSRKDALGLAARTVFGGLSGAVLFAAAGHALVLGALLGAVGGIAGGFAGYEARTWLVRTLRVPDVIIALLEDAIAIGAAFFIVSRFK